MGMKGVRIITFKSQVCVPGSTGDEAILDVATPTLKHLEAFHISLLENASRRDSANSFTPSSTSRKVQLAHDGQRGPAGREQWTRRLCLLHRRKCLRRRLAWVSGEPRKGRQMNRSIAQFAPACVLAMHDVPLFAWFAPSRVIGAKHSFWIEDACSCLRKGTRAHQA